MSAHYVFHQQTLIILGGFYIYPDLMPTSFQWGELSGSEFRDAVSSTYNEIVHLKCSLFLVFLLVPQESRKVTWSRAISSLIYQAYAEHSSLEAVALKACSVVVALVLQKPSRISKNKDHVNFLSRRFALWKEVRFLLSWMRVTVFSGTLDLVVPLIRIRLPVLSII